MSDMQRESFDEPTKQKIQIEFIVMRILSRLQKTGKDIKNIFEGLTKNKEKIIGNDTFIAELNRNYLLYISQEEAGLLIAHLDTD